MFITRALATRAGIRQASTLKQVLAAKIPLHNAEAKEVKTKYANHIIGTCTVEQAYGGARSVKSMVYETSLLDPEEGIRFRGYTIPECQAKLPKAKGGSEPLPEALFWLLLTGDIPTQEECDSVTKEWQSRSQVPSWVTKVQCSLPRDLHPMTQLVIGAGLLQKDSKFVEAYNKGMKKSDYWDPCYEDCMDLLAKLPTLCSTIYRHTYKEGKLIPSNKSFDWAQDFAHMMGFTDPQFEELMRLYMVIHSDHEGGNVSAHTVHLVGSALSDPYLAFAAGMAGLAGPLHGLANQEVLNWTLDFQKQIGTWNPTDEQIEKALWDTLNSGRVVPGYGHAVLRKTDPRYVCQREFALKHLPNDPLFKIVGQIFKIAPGVLTKQGKTKNPWPNVDAHSGCLLQYYGLTEQAFYTVLFGASRAIGTCAALVWDRAMGTPIERPKSITTAWIKKNTAALVPPKA